MSPIAIAIVGATGLLGGPLTHTLLSPAYRPSKIAKVIIITRDPTSSKAKGLIGAGAKAIQASDESISAEHLKGVDVLINAIGGEGSVETRNRYAKAASDAGVKVYFPPEFGIDRRVIDVDNEIWNGKKKHADYAASLGLKVISVYTGGFLDIAFGGLFGYDFDNKLFSCWGETSVKGTFTALKDISASVAELALLAAENPDSAPSDVRIAGDCKSTDELAAVFGKESGDTIATKGLDYPAKKAEIDGLAKGKGYHMEYLRLIFASGALDWSDENNNELVNPGGTKWTWKTAADVAKETKGKPVYFW